MSPDLLLTIHIAPPGIEMASIRKPYNKDNANAFSDPTPINPNPIIIAPSLIPHPAIEIGNIINSVTIGTITSSPIIFNSNYDELELP